MPSGTMGLQSLQQLIESQFAGACVSVDLLRIASSVASPYQGRVALSLVVDAECCLDRLYGGYVSGKQFFIQTVQFQLTNMIYLFCYCYCFCLQFSI